MKNSSITNTPIKKISNNIFTETIDILAVEEPLEIRIEYFENGLQKHKSISVTMRTPGNDFELAVGFLFTENIISTYNEIEKITYVPGTDKNVVLIELNKYYMPNINKLERNFYTTSSCGICGKASINAVRVLYKNKDLFYFNNPIDFTASAVLICSLPEMLRKNQNVFEQTGGLHACAFFNLAGNLIDLKEDVGRHNALDKLIGTKIINNTLNNNSECILLLSGRASFELLQKAIMAGIKMVVAVGAPSSLAVELAEEFNITLIGFLRGEKFNIYSGSQRIVI